MQQDEVIFVSGGQTLIAAALRRELARQGYTRVIAAEDEPDLTDDAAVDVFFAEYRPRYVFHAGGKSGGILANQRHPAEFIRDNLLGNLNVVHAAHENGVRKLLYLASSCSYPRMCPQPMKEEHLFTGPLEPTNEAYAMAKLAGLTLCQAYRRQYKDDFIVGIPANAFGLEDDFSPEESHVIGGLMRRMEEAKRAGRAEVTVWGTGRVRREFIFADDLADACVYVMDRYSAPEPINLGGGQDVAIAELAELIRGVVGFGGAITYDSARPDGMPLKALDSARLKALGWRPRTALRQALEQTYRAFLQSVPPSRTVDA